MGWSGAGPMARSEQAERKGVGRGAGLHAERPASSGCVQAIFGLWFLFCSWAWTNWVWIAVRVTGLGQVRVAGFGPG